MATSVFDQIRLNKSDSEKSYRWFQTQIRNLGSRASAQDLMKESNNLKNNIIPGEMYLFFYDPKHKETLPYYDKFPLVLPFNTVKNGFYGINLHYLPYLMRFRLLQALTDLATNDKNNSTTRIKISWRILTTFSKIAPVQNAVKHYLSNHVQTRFLKINYPDWVTASQLPIENFVGAKKEAVWNITSKGN